MVGLHIFCGLDLQKMIDFNLDRVAILQEGKLEEMSYREQLGAFL